MTAGFGERLVAAGRAHGRLCVGIDPHPQLLAAWGLTDDAAGLSAFARACATAFAGHVALVKPQVAFFERFGAAGLSVLEETIATLRAAGTLVVADAKRGDIGSTMRGYALAWLSDASPLCCDAVTLSPYLGVGALDPALDLAEETGRGVFVLAATSNPEAVELQRFRDAAGTTLAQHVVDRLAERNAAAAAAGAPVGFAGVVVGATVANPPDLSRLGAPVLLPGVGAQGATSEDVRRIVSGRDELAFPNVSRSVLAAGPDPERLRQAAVAQAADFA